MKLLFVNGCISQRGEESRTLVLARSFLDAWQARHPEAEVETVEYERYLSRLASGDFDLFIAEVCVGDNVDLSPLISGSSVGISGDCSDAQLLEQYYAYCAGTLDCTGFLEQFDRYAPVTPLVYRQGGAVVSPSFHAVMTPVSQDIFYNIKEWQ